MMISARMLIVVGLGILLGGCANVPAGAPCDVQTAETACVVTIVSGGWFRGYSARPDTLQIERSTQVKIAWSFEPGSIAKFDSNATPEDRVNITEYTHAQPNDLYNCNVYAEAAGIRIVDSGPFFVCRIRPINSVLKLKYDVRFTDGQGKSRTLDPTIVNTGHDFLSIDPATPIPGKVGAKALTPCNSTPCEIKVSAAAVVPLPTPSPPTTADSVDVDISVPDSAVLLIWSLPAPSNKFVGNWPGQIADGLVVTSSNSPVSINCTVIDKADGIGTPKDVGPNLVCKVPKSASSFNDLRYQLTYHINATDQARIGGVITRR